MTQRNFIAATLATLLAGSVGAAQTVSPKPDKFAVRVKMRDAAGKLTLVSVGELTRANGKVTARGLPAPAIDRLADDFIAAWKAYKYPPSVAVSESIASDTGMMPAYTNYTFTFTPKDRLYMPAVLREFVAKSGYEALGMTSVHFIDRDMTAEFPPNAHDRAAQIINIRKGTSLEDSAGYVSFFIKAPVRPKGLGKPDSVLRVSVSNPKIALAQNFDDGTATIVYMQLFKDGHVEQKPMYAGAQFVSHWGVFDGTEAQTLPLIQDGSWKTVVVKPTSPWLVEARILGVLESGWFYDISPALDPALIH